MAIMDETGYQRGSPTASEPRRSLPPRKSRSDLGDGSSSNAPRTNQCLMVLVMVVGPLALMALGASLWRRYQRRDAEVAYPVNAAQEPASAAASDRFAPQSMPLSPKDFKSWQSLEEVPRNDARTYETAVLKNGLRVLSIQDPRSLSAGFALAVKAGSFDDPPELPGLMHFCEHMLFLGTEKYPDPEGFDDFVNMHGGYQNAYTAPEVTNYHVELDAAAAHEGMDRFAEFFRAPLFSPKFARKEVNAIDSEHAKNVQSSSARIYAVMMSLADPSSPVSKFHTGNVDTLPTDNTPAGNHTFGMLRSRFEELYCPSRMRLVTFGPDEPGTQLQSVASTFGRIPEGMESCARHPRPSYANPKAWPPERLGRWVDIQGTTPHALLWLTFPLPDLSTAYASQPLDYITWALNYDGEDSLLQVLRDSVGLAYTVSVDTDSNSAGTVVIVVFGLTEAGRKRPDLVLEVLFAYLAMLRMDGINEALQSSLEKSSQQSWDWAEPSDPFSTVMDLAERLTHVSATDVLWGDSLTRRRDMSLTRKVLELLQPSNMNAAFIDPRNVTDSSRFSLGQKPVEEESLPYFSVHYGVRGLAEVIPGAPSRWNGWLSKLSSRDSVVAELIAELHKGDVALAKSDIPKTPPPIKDMSSELNLDHAHAKSKGSTLDEEEYGAAPESSAAADLAAVLPSSSIAASSELWYREGWTSNMPKGSPLASLSVLFRAVQPTNAPEAPAIDIVRASLYSRMLGEEIGPQLQDMSDAGAMYSVGVSEAGLHISFNGFPPVVKALVPQVLSELHGHLKLQSVHKRFDRIVELYKEELRSYSDMPISYAIGDRGVLLTKGAYSRAQLLTAIHAIDEHSAASAVEEVLLPKQLHMIAMAMGNIDRDEVMHSTAAVAGGIKRPAGLEVSSEAGEVQRITPILHPSRPVEIRALNPRAGDENHVLVMSFLYGVLTVPSRAVLGLLGQILGQVCFNVLRTAMQLGYVANGGEATMSNVQLISAVVQGNKEDADKMESAAHRVFFVDMPKKLDEITDDEFLAYKESFMDSLLQKPYHTGDEVAHFWSPISTGSHCFDLRTKMMRYMNESLTSKEILKSAWQRLIMPDSGVRKRVIVKYFPKQVPPRPTTGELEKDWQSHGIAGNMQELLRREYKDTLILDKADSESREQVLRQSEYFPTTWTGCDVTDEQLLGSGGKRSNTNTSSSASSLLAVDEADTVADVSRRSRWLRQGGFALQPQGLPLNGF
mmetsp:Transcript_53764/g.128103  ORF Transcript_53764/g.128103 Transcript_53764/m.128103 type:complete len:1233 (+) Transcript_53764:103-3801(+)